MRELLSVGEIIDKLTIELIKAHSVREAMHSSEKDSKEYVAAYEKLTILNANRGVLKNALDSKIEEVKNGGTNRVLKHCRTY